MNTETQIKNLVRTAQRFVEAKTPDVDFSKPNHLYVRWQGITVELVAHSVFSRSFYRVIHPTLGRFEGNLNDYTWRNGSFGISPGKPQRK